MEATNERSTILPVIHRQVPANPFYVRWLNQLAGYDYYMFQNQQKISITTADRKTVTRYEREQPGVRFGEQTITLNGERKITVGAEHLDNTEFEALSLIQLSPIVEWYNESAGRWINILVDKAELARNTSSDRHALEITFKLPELNTQF